MPHNPPAAPYSIMTAISFSVTGDSIAPSELAAAALEIMQGEADATSTNGAAPPTTTMTVDFTETTEFVLSVPGAVSELPNATLAALRAAACSGPGVSSCEVVLSGGGRRQLQSGADAVSVEVTRTIADAAVNQPNSSSLADNLIGAAGVAVLSHEPLSLSATVFITQALGAN